MAFKPNFTVNISKRYTEEERAAIAAEILDHILERTDKGKDVDGNRFPRYSKGYSDLKGQSNVDLRLSGEMLSELGLLKNEKGKIVIGYDESSSVVGKVEGNCLGTYGRDDVKKTNKARNFLGISEKDLEKILKNYPLGSENKEERISRVEGVAFGDLIGKNVLDLISFDFDMDN